MAAVKNARREQCPCRSWLLVLASHFACMMLLLRTIFSSDRTSSPLPDNNRDALSPYLKCDEPSEHDDHADRLQRSNDFAKHKSAEDRRRQRFQMHDHSGAEGSDADRREKYEQDRRRSGEAKRDQIGPAQRGVRYIPGAADR